MKLKLFVAGIGILGIAAIGVAVVLLAPKEKNFQTTVTISMGDDEFTPRAVTIQKSTTVVFENVGENDHWPASNIHPTHEIYPEFDPGKPIQPGERWSFRFERAGSWNFHDHLHPQFTGTITVVEEKVEREEQQEVKSSPSVKNKPVLKTEFHNPSPYDLGTLYQTISLNCDSTNFPCIKNAVRAVAKEYGPEAATLILERWYTEGLVHRGVDNHQLSHEIGRQTAETFGVNSQAFLLCPMSAVNGGCQHGYFEYVLGKTNTATEAANLICESLDDSYSSKFKFYCYHGIGHGVMMAQAYNLYGALATCDAFHDQTGCWQGVFMENVIAGMQGKARQGIFSQTDPLAPCNVVEEKYRWQCYINHSGYVMGFFNNSIGKASSACLEAGEDKAPCLQALGLLTTNPSWQNSITGQNDFDRNVKIALQLCDQFPPEVQTDCFVGALDNILNYDEMNLSERAIPFCKQVTGWSKEMCYRQIGINIARQVVGPSERKGYCEQVEPDYHSDCFAGAGI